VLASTRVCVRVCACVCVCVRVRACVCGVCVFVCVLEPASALGVSRRGRSGLLWVLGVGAECDWGTPQ